MANDAIQISSEESRKVKKPQIGHFQKAKLKQVFRISRELRLKQPSDDWQLGQEMLLSDFAAGEAVEVTGTSKGKGFAGGIKRHHFSRHPKTHGGKEIFAKSVQSVRHSRRKF